MCDNVGPVKHGRSGSGKVPKGGGKNVCYLTLIIGFSNDLKD
jgi:hypothetical protein